MQHKAAIWPNNRQIAFSRQALYSHELYFSGLLSTNEPKCEVAKLAINFCNALIRSRTKILMPVEQATIAPQQIIRVAMGGIEYAQRDEVLETLLGSCIGLVMWCRRTHIAGMAHIVLPDCRECHSMPGKYANTAVAELRQRLIARGAHPQKLVTKLAGGATMFGEKLTSDIGGQNYRAVIKLLQEVNIPVLGEHVGQNFGRIIKYHCDTSQLEVFVGRKLVATI
jgi:chemotaxis protein CheD